MEAIILAGGLGQRLRSVVSDVPKPMASVAGKPFLHHLVNYVIKQGITHIIFSVGYKGDIIVDYFRKNSCGIDISVAHENEPLGTGGAILNGLRQSREDRVFVLNGDTFLALDYQAVARNHKKHTASLSMALRYLDHNDRYGRAILKDDHIIGFKSAREAGAGWVNAGVYLMDRNLMNGFDLPEKFSFEQDFIEAHIQKINPLGFRSDTGFIDIGVPEDYHRAADFLAAMGELS